MFHFNIECSKWDGKVQSDMSAAIAAVLEQFEAPLRLRELPLPARVAPGAALVRTEMAGICGTDVHLWKGQLPIALPVILGHETVGRLEQLGDGLEHDWTGQPLKRGDRVTWNSAASCGQCYYCAEKRQPTRCPQRRAYGIGYRCDQAPHLLGGCGEFHYLHPRTTIFKLPDDLPTESVIGAGCALITAIHGIERTGVAWRDNVVVHEGKIAGLRRFKDDVSEVKSGFECGISFDKYNDIKVGDVIEVVSQEQIPAATA